MGEGLEHPMLGEILGDEDDFGKPGRHRWPFLRRGLESNTRGVCNHESNLPFRIPRHSRFREHLGCDGEHTCSISEQEIGKKSLMTILFSLGCCEIHEG